LTLQSRTKIRLAGCLEYLKWVVGGGWTCSGAAPDAITSAANFSGGAGGRGFRHFEGDGTNVNGGGIIFNFITRRTEFYVRWYMRYQSGFVWSNLNYDKLIYIDVGLGYIIPGWDGDNNLRVYSSAGGGIVSRAINKGWAYSMGGVSSDGNFHLHELHIKTDTDGTDGVVQYWLDEELIIDDNDVDLGTNSGGWRRILFGSNQKSPGNGGCEFQDYDDIAIATTGPIGPIGAGATVAAVTGSVTNDTEADIVTGGSEVIITLTNDTWVASGSTFDNARQAIIDGMDSAQSEGTGWNAEVRDKEVVGAVVRTSDTVATITLTAAGSYNITEDEIIAVTVPASAMVTSSVDVAASNGFSIIATGVVSATLGGTVGNDAEADVVSGGSTITLTLTNDTWNAAGSAFDNERQAIINGLDSAESETTGWNAEVRDKEVVGAVVRTSDTVVTITLTAASSYDITTQETITMTIPASALVTSSSAVIATPNFVITIDPPFVPDAISPTWDTYINQGGGATVNYATINQVNLYTFPANEPGNAILLKFDAVGTITPGSTVISATLKLMLKEADVTGDATYTVGIHRIINVSPVETQATGTIYSTGNNWTANMVRADGLGMAQADIATAEDTVGINKTLNEFKTWTVTAMVQYWVNNPNENYGLLINSDDSLGADRFRYFYSNEEAISDRRPLLSITHTLPGFWPKAAKFPTGSGWGSAQW